MERIKDICLTHDTIAYYAGDTNFEVKHIDYIQNQLYMTEGHGVNQSYHKLKIYFTPENSYVMLNGKRLYLSDFMRSNLC